MTGLRKLPSEEEEEGKTVPQTDFCVRLVLSVFLLGCIGIAAARHEGEQPCFRKHLGNKVSVYFCYL